MHILQSPSLSEETKISRCMHLNLDWILTVINIQVISRRHLQSRPMLDWVNTGSVALPLSNCIKRLLL